MRLLPVVVVVTALALAGCGSDDDTSRSGAVNATQAAAELDGQGLVPAKTYGPTRAIAPARGELGEPRELPQVRRYDVDNVRGIVHVDGSGPETIVDGGAPSLAVIALNDAIADGRDVSWIWDVDFEPLLAGLDRLLATGERAAELALRFKYAGMDPDAARFQGRL